MNTAWSAIGALGMTCASIAGTLPPPSDFESVRFIKVWEPEGQRLAPPIGTAVADFNRDTKPDVVSLTADDAFIALGDGSGGFSSPINLPFRGSALASADFNADGNPDIAFAAADGIAIALGGNAAFASPFIVTAAANPSAIATGDFNADTRPDLIWRDPSGVHVAISAQPTTFGAPTFVTDASGDIVIGALDVVPGDDLAIGSGIYYARSGGSFATGPSIPADRIAGIADMDGDTIPDLVCEFISPAPEFAASLAVARQNAGKFTLDPATPLNDPGPHHVAVADFDVDGTLDIAAVSSRSYLQGSIPTVGRRVIVLLNQAGTPSVNQALMAGGAVADSLIAADMDSDLRPDLIASNRGARLVHVPTAEVRRFGRSVTALLNGPDADFRAPQALRAGGFAPDAPCVVWDIDGDGDKDLVTGGPGSTPSRMRIKRNLQNGRFSDLDVYVSFPQGSVSPNLSPGIRDWNADGVSDLVLGPYDVRLDTTLSPPTGYEPGITLRATLIPSDPPVPQPSQFSRWLYADLDGDAVEDVIQFSGRSNSHTPGLRILLRRGESYTDPLVLFEGERVDAVQTGQFDNQPGLDLAVAVRGSYDAAQGIGRDYTFVILLNDSTGAFAPIVELPIGDDVLQLFARGPGQAFFASGKRTLRRIMRSGIDWIVTPLALQFTPLGEPIVHANPDADFDVLSIRPQHAFDSPAILEGLSWPSWLANHIHSLEVARFPWSIASAQPAKLNSDDRDDLVLRDGIFGDLLLMQRKLHTRCPGDANDDHIVNAADLSLIVSGIQFGAPVSPSNDLNSDSRVDGRDLSVVLANFGRSCN